jgi:chromosome segregation ATPase
MTTPRKTALTPSSLRRSALPKSESRTYLQIYQLTAERKRLERGLADWRQRVSDGEKTLAKLEARIIELQHETEVISPRVTPKRVPLGPGGSMVLEY